MRMSYAAAAAGGLTLALLAAVIPAVSATTSPPVTPSPAHPRPPVPLALAVVTLPPGAPRPRVHSPAPLPPVGSGAHAVVSAIPSSVWTRMQGLSWRPGCTPRSSLRYITVNFWGFDGYPHRGEIVMAAGAAGATASAFTRLFNVHVPIRSMVLPDAYGHDPLGPGANDYASMAADNTSGFNCRYIDGKESWHAWSPHAYGTAIDINPWENPYWSVAGMVPNSWWMPRTRPGTEVFRAGGAAVRAFAAAGFRWGDYYSDYQHVQH